MGINEELAAEQRAKEYPVPVGDESKPLELEAVITSESFPMPDELAGVCLRGLIASHPQS
jgi:hypothetical protein